MRDYVLGTPKTVEELVLAAQNMGFTELVLLAEPKNAVLLHAVKEDLVKKTKIKLLFGIVAQNKAQIPKKHEFDVVVKLGTSEKEVFDGLTHVLDVEFDKEKDFVHQRRSGLNHVLLAEYKKKGVSLLFGFAKLQYLSSSRQAQILGRVMQNVQLCQKQTVSYDACSFASKPEELRDAKDVAALARTLGL